MLLVTSSVRRMVSGRQMIATVVCEVLVLGNGHSLCVHGCGYFLLSLARDHSLQVLGHNQS